MANWWWIDPVFDRVLQDATDRTKKGEFNAIDISRIENNIGNLSRNMLTLVGTVKDWTRYGFPDPADFSRIIQNATILKQVYPFIDINVQPNILRWDLTNDIEQILFEIKRIWDNAITWECFDRGFDWAAFDIEFENWEDFDENVIDWIYFDGGFDERHGAIFINWDDFESKVPSWKFFETHTWCYHMDWISFDSANRGWNEIDEEGFFINA